MKMTCFLPKRRYLVRIKDIMITFLGEARNKNASRLDAWHRKRHALNARPFSFRKHARETSELHWRYPLVHEKTNRRKDNLAERSLILLMEKENAWILSCGSYKNILFVLRTPKMKRCLVISKERDFSYK